MYKPKAVKAVLPLFLADGAPIFLYYYQSAANWDYLVFMILALVIQYKLQYLSHLNDLHFQPQQN
jgi:hypothetical protein